MNQDRFTLIRSNSWEKLFNALKERIRQDYSAKLFEPVTLIVRNTGMRNYIIRKFTEQEGIFANTQFYYPENLSRFFPQNDTENLSGDINYLFTFEVFSHLSDPEFYSEFTGNQSGNQAEIKIYKTAENISHLLINSMYYNPEPFLKERLPNRKAQLLWEKVNKTKQFNFAHELYLKLKNAMQGNFPETVYVFGIPFLTGFEYLMLSLLSQQSRIYYFQQTPTDLYWFDKTPISFLPKKEPKLKQDEPIRIETPEAFQASEKIANHDFLTYFGKAQRVFERHLIEAGAYDHNRDLFETENELSVLSFIRRSMLHNENKDFPDNIDETDRSFRVHSCPDKFQEVTVIYNEVLEMLESGAVSPTDILVTAPDISGYKAAIDDVFGLNPEKIPHFTADRAEFIQSECYLILAFILNHSSEDISTEYLKTFLDFEAVRNKFGISPEEHQKMNRWLDNIPIYKILGTSDVTENETPDPTADNLSRFWDRSIYGYIFEQQNTATYKNILPYPYLLGMDQTALGKLKMLTDVLARVQSEILSDETSVEKSRSITEWGHYIEYISELVMGEIPPQNQTHLTNIINRIAKIGANSTSMKFGKAVFRNLFNSISREYKSFSGGTVGNGICFSSMLNIRGIPFKAIYIMGLNQEDFPGGNSGKSDHFFDNVFYPEPDIQEHRLHALISFFLNARERLHLSYIGYDYEKNHEIPLPISIELILTHLNTYANSPQNTLKTVTKENNFLVKHPLNPFHYSYFEKNPDRFSYSNKNEKLSRFVYGNKREIAHQEDTAEHFPDFSQFTESNLNLPESLYLDDLVKFLSHPVRAFCQNVLKIKDYMPSQPDVKSEYEPIEIGKKQKGIMGDMVDFFADADKQIPQVKRALDAIGQFPQKLPGRYFLREYIEAGQKITSHLPNYPQLENENRVLSAKISGTEIQGMINLHGGRLFQIIPDTIWFNQLIRFYVEHLFFNSVNGAESSFLLGGVNSKKIQSPVLFELPANENAEDELEGLLKLYHSGQQVPLCILPAASMNIIIEFGLKKLNKNDAEDEFFNDSDLDKNLDKVHLKKPDTEFQISDHEYDFKNFYIQLCYTEPSNLPFTFKEDFKRLCLPLLTSLRIHHEDLIKQKFEQVFGE